MPTLYHRKGVWYVNFSVDGRQRRVSLGTKDRQVAKDTLKDLSARLRLGVLGLPLPANNPPIGKLFDEYLEYEKAHRSPRTHMDTKHHVEKHLRPALGEIGALDLEKKDVEGFIGAMKEEGYHPRTINLRLETLRKVLRRAVSHKTIPAMPCDIQLLPTPETLPRFLTPAEVKAVLGGLGEYHRLRVEFVAVTGIPDSEIGRLRWQNVDMVGRVVRFRRDKTQRQVVVPLNDRGLEIIKRMRGGGPTEPWKKIKEEPDYGAYVFGGIKSIRAALRALSRRLGRTISAHMFRHSFATHLLSAGVPLAHVSTLLGHTSQKTTERYAKVLPEYLRAAVAILDRPEKQHKTAQAGKSGLGKTRSSH